VKILVIMSRWNITRCAIWFCDQNGLSLMICFTASITSSRDCHPSLGPSLRIEHSSVNDSVHLSTILRVVTPWPYTSLSSERMSGLSYCFSHRKWMTIQSSIPIGGPFLH
jgi:hypothetical protein